MGTVVVLLVIVALAVGGVGLLVEGLLWLLAIGVALLVVAAIAGYALYRRVGSFLGRSGGTRPA